MSRRPFPNILAFFLVLTLLVWLAPVANADQDDPPTRVARLAYEQGSVSFQPAGTDDWVAPGINRPITTGDKLWADNDGRVELQLDGSIIHVANNSGFSFLNLNDNVTQIQLTSGTISVRVRRVDENETYEIDTPNLAFSVLRPGTYRIRVNENGDGTFISVRNGEGEVTGGGAAYAIRAGESYSFSGTDQLYANQENYESDQFETWAGSRDRRWENSRSSHYVSADVIGYEDLDEYGSWREVPDYGNVWFPRTSQPDWAPYHYGHWDYIEPWGYTWVDDEPWGFAPFHYGRWLNVQGAWCWVPAPPRSERAEYVRPVYAPALVAWVGDGAGAEVAWFPLGPQEVYVPSYRVSRQYVNNVNVSNTTVNTTVVNNYYNTTVVNNTTAVTNVKYLNRNVPGAVVATTPQAFTSAQPVAKNIVKVNQQAAASAPVRVVAPPVAPAKQAVLGPTTSAAKKPPATVESRTVVAKAAPPPPPPSFERRQEAIRNNGGKPLSPAQMRQIQPAAARTAAPVKMAPPPKSGTTASTNRAPGQPSAAPSAKTAPAPPPANRPAPPKPEPNKPAVPNPAAPPNRPTEGPPTPNGNTKPEPNKPATPTPSPNRPPERPATPNNPAPSPRTDRPPAAQPPKQPPAAAQPATPPVTNPALDNKHQQEQEQLRLRQEQERQKLQQEQQQQRQHADQAQKQRLEQEHQQQNRQLQQKHEQEQKQLQQKQQQERQDQKKPQKPEPQP